MFHAGQITYSVLLRHLTVVTKQLKAFEMSNTASWYAPTGFSVIEDCSHDFKF